MKRKNKTYTPLLLLCSLMISILSGSSYGQTDTTIIRLAEEESSQSDFYYKSRYSYLDINMKEDRSLIKFGCFPFIPGENFGFDIIFVQVSYESKIGKQFSITREINSNYYISDYSYLRGPVQPIFNNLAYSARTSRTGFGLTCRFYPGMKKRIESGNGADNLNGGYLAFNALDLFSFVTRRSYEYPYGTRKESNLEFSPQFQFAAGYQKRISRLLYFDTQIFRSYRLNGNNSSGLFENSWGVKLLLGIAFNPKDI
jgi:hypothetical protein